MPTNDNFRVVVGRLGRPHGIRGEISVEIRTDEPETRFAPGSLLFSADDVKAKPLVVKSARWQGNHLMLAFEGYADRTAVEALRGRVLEVPVAEDELPDGEDEYYDRQLIGLSVVIDGVMSGTVADVLHLPGQDVLSVKTEAGEVLLPFVSAFVTDVNLTERTVTVNPPVGLFAGEAEEA